MTNEQWHCPAHPTGSVPSTGDRFRCDECGQTNHPMDLPGVDRVWIDEAPEPSQVVRVESGDVDPDRPPAVDYWGDATKTRRVTEMVDGVVIRETLSTWGYGPSGEWRLLGQRTFPEPRHIRIESWRPGNQFTVSSGDRVSVDQCPKDGTCSSRVSGIWYGNAEIKDYVNRQGAWRPYSGLFRIVPGIGLLPGLGPEDQVEVGWYREEFGEDFGDE